MAEQQPRTDRHIKIMHAQFKRAVSTPNAHIKFAMSSDVEPWRWYILIHNVDGDENEFKGGEYICEMVAPPNFPVEPPSFNVITPNGIYTAGQRPCIHIGEFHKSSYQQTLGMAGFAMQVVSGFIGWRDLQKSGGIFIMNSTVDEKRKYAQESIAFNATLPATAIINASYDEYSKAWNKA